MSWPINPALDALNEAALTYSQIHGLDAMMSWHGHELQRLRVHRDMVLARRAAVAPPEPAVPPRIDPEHEKTMSVLDFYADPTHYRTSARKPVSEVMRDAGDRARARVAEVEALYEQGVDGENGGMAND